MSSMCATLPSICAPCLHFSVLPLYNPPFLSLNQMSHASLYHPPDLHSKLTCPPGSILRSSPFLELSKNVADQVSSPVRINLLKTYLRCSEIYAGSVVGTMLSFSYLESSGI